MSRRSLAQYRNLLDDQARIEAAVRAPDGPVLVAYSIKGERGLSLAELQTSPPLVKHSTETNLECGEGDQCASRLTAYEVRPGSVALLAVMVGEGPHGQGNFTSSQAELRMLLTDGFGHPLELPAAEDSTTAHGVVEESTTLRWVDTSGDGPAGILALHRASSEGTLLGNDTLPGWSRSSFELFTFDTVRGAYEEAEIAAETPQKELQRLARGSAFFEY
ncbi:MAG TPA: hypothetical protein VEQ58_24085 [Polyangiaceae bacterium]|nr:hypothetical protein [Polyangiaceae bacterium]